jgi:hypothetical protein
MIALKGREADAALEQMSPMDDGSLQMDVEKSRDVRVSLRVEVASSKLPYLNEPRLLIILRPI